jgi:two-component system, chemotaxis family, sensor kinase CheA
MDELIEQFLIEGRELVQQASDDLMALEDNPSDAGRIDSAFRAVHTLKGSVGFFDFAAMGELLHAAEDLLGAVRDGRLTATRTIVGALLDCIGASEGWIDSIERTRALPPDADVLGLTLRAAMAPYLGDAARAVVIMPEADITWTAILIERNRDAVGEIDTGQAITALRYTPSADCFFLGDDPLALVRSIPGLIALEIGAREAWTTEKFDPFVCNLVIEALTSAPIDDVRRVFRLVPDQTVIVETQADAAAPQAGDGPVAAEGGRDGAARTLRVDAARIDALADIIGELVVAKNGFAHLVSQAAESDPKLGRALGANQANIDRLVGDMHRAVMTMRMIPFARTFQRFPRVVRDIAGRLGKSVTFTVAGEEVEADKSIVDGIFEPLLHVLRNAIDHGIEDAETRRGAKKPADGHVRLEARRVGDQIMVSVTDDGAGIDLDAVRRLAKSRNLMEAAAVDALDDAAALDLIFVPGFSTASAVTDVSGRGVGMDAVRSAVETLGGRILVTSTRGAGSAIELLLPQAFVINTIMTVRVGDERFGVPIEMVQETMRIAVDRIVPIREGEAFVVRNRTVPLLRLADLLNLPRIPRPDDIRVLIAASGDERIGIEVDGFAERFDVVLRPMQGLLSGMPGVLGTALLGDGQVLMVLDLQELIG